MEESYSVLARYYDALMSDNDYGAICSFYGRLMEKYAKDAPKKAVDLGCGTGGVTVGTAALGYETFGIDTSFEMLAAAENKAENAKVKIVYSEQDMRYFDVGENFGLAVCAFDGINYLTGKDDLSLCAERVKNTLAPGGLFVFDVNTPYKYENVLADNSFVYELDGFFLVWRSFYMKKRTLCDYYLTFFEEKSGIWKRADEYQRQRSYSDAKIKKTLSAAGFELVGEWADPCMSPVTEKSERIFYAWKRK